MEEEWKETGSKRWVADWCAMPRSQDWGVGVRV